MYFPNLISEWNRYFHDSPLLNKHNLYLNGTLHIESKGEQNKCDSYSSKAREYGKSKKTNTANFFLYLCIDIVFSRFIPYTKINQIRNENDLDHKNKLLYEII